MNEPVKCRRRWGRWIFHCPRNPDGRTHECAGDRGHFAVHICRHCGAHLLIGLL